MWFTFLQERQWWSESLAHCIFQYLSLTLISGAINSTGRCLLNHEWWGKPMIDMVLWMFQEEINVVSIDYGQKSKTSRDAHLPCVAHMYWEINANCFLDSNSSFYHVTLQTEGLGGRELFHSSLLPLDESSDWIHPVTEDFRFLNLMNEFLAVLGLRCCVGFSLLWEAGATLWLHYMDFSLR